MQLRKEDLDMNICIEKETDLDLGFDCDELINKVITYAADYVGCPYEFEVNVVLTDNDTIHKVNKETRNIDRVTDVLSFPMAEYDEPGDFSRLEDEDMFDVFNPETGELLLGDIMVSLEKVVSQAEEYGHSTTRELGFLIAHSMLHLFGYDHMEEDERVIMEAKQNEIMNGLEIYR